MTVYQIVNIDALEPLLQKKVITTMIAGMKMDDVGGKKAPFQIPPAVAIAVVKALDALPKSQQAILSRREYMKHYMARRRAKIKAETQAKLAAQSNVA